ncbi:MAG: hypothetical protein WCD76_12445 [Pyrinomonadaceae bacterium]
MAKTSEKVAADKQPESQRGKSRFGVQPRSNRVVLPDRPPREIDNEIVSILLGGDPTSLAAPIAEESTSPVATVPTSHSKADIAPSLQDRRQDDKPTVSDKADITQQVEVASSSEPSQVSVTDSQTSISSVSDTPSRRSLSKVEVASPVPVRGVSGRGTSLTHSTAARSSGLTSENTQAQDLTITSFEDFAERWKHGMRKGQLKVCEVLYQKTYALGETECVTSFSELGRLSGLKMRQCFNIIAQLEALKFVERAKSENTSNKKDQGSIIRFFLFPKN